MDKAELQRRITEGNLLQKAGGLATILGENIFGGLVDDYDSPGERFGSAVNYALRNPKEAGIAALNEFERAYRNVATPRYDDQGRMTVDQDQAMDALGLASLVPAAGATTALASGARLTDLLEFDPDTAQMFIGVKGAAKMAENGNYTALNALNLAKRLEDEGYSDADIRLATNKFIAEGDPTLGGIDRNAAGQFRLEIADDQLELTSLLSDTGMALPVDKAITGSQITEAYPKDFTLRMAPEEEGEMSYGKVLGARTGDELETYVGEDISKAQPVMLHELQHGIQSVEGFPQGGNTGAANLGSYGPLRDDFAEALEFLKDQRDTNFNVYNESEELSGNALKAYRELLQTNDYDVHDAIADATETVEALSDPATEQMLANQYYYLLAGEAEANTTMARRDMTGPQRRAKPPVETEQEIGLPRNQQIVFGPDKNPVYVGNTAQAQTMSREVPPDVAEEILAQKIRNLQNDMVLREKEMRVDGKSTSEIDEMKAEKRREIFELQGLPPDMDDFYAKGGAVEGVGSLSRVARDMFRGPRGIATLSRFAEGGGVTKEDLIEDMIRMGFNPKGLRSEGRVAFGEGNYDEAALKYLMGTMGEVPLMGELYAGLGSILERSEDAGEALKNLVYDEDGRFLGASRDYIKSKVRGYSQGGSVISPASEEEITEMRIKVIEDYGFDPVDVAIEEGVDPELLLRVMWTENKGRQGPRSDKGAIGLMQLMPGTAEELGVDPNDPLDNTRGGARYLKKMLEQFESVPLALAAYNAGPGNVQDYGGIPPFKETQNYVAQIAPPLTGEDVDRMVKDSDENLLMSMPVAAEGEYSPVPQLRPFNLPTYIGEPATSPRPMLRPETEEATPMPLEALPGVVQGQKTNLYEKYGGGIASLANP